jgi:hypothetical protein
LKLLARRLLSSAAVAPKVKPLPVVSVVVIVASVVVVTGEVVAVVVSSVKVNIQRQ